MMAEDDGLIGSGPGGQQAQFGSMEEGEAGGVFTLTCSLQWLHVTVT